MGKTYGEDFNREEAKKVLERWYADTSQREDIARRPDRVFDKDVDALLHAKNNEVNSQRIQSQVQRLMNLGLNEKEIGDALDKGIGNLAQEYKDQTGNFSTKSSRDPENVLTAIINNIQSSHKGGRSDEDLNKAYEDFSAYLDKDLNKMFKDMPFENREALVAHIKSDKSNVDKIIKAEAMKLLKESGSNYDASSLVKKLSNGLDPSKLDVAIAGMYTIARDPDATTDEITDYIRNFDDSTALEQEELKVSGPPAATETAEGGEMGPSQAGAGGFDQNEPRTVFEQDRDGNWITGEKIGYGALEQWVSKPTLVDGVEPDNTRLNEYYDKVEKETQERKAIALEKSIYDRTRGDAATDYTRDLAQDKTYYDRDLAQDKTYYDRDLAQESIYYERGLDQDEEYYIRDIAREDAKQKELNARYDVQRNQDMKRADLIMLGQWTRDDEVAYRNREWNIDDRRDDRLWEEAQQAEDRTFQTGQLAMQMGPQYFQSQLDAAEFEKDVLRNASDYIASAFMQRGEASPFKAVTQADLINGFRAKARDMMQATEEGFRPPLESPEEFAAQIVGSASGGAAASVGAALGGTYNPDPGGAPPAGTNTGTNTGPKTGPKTGTGPPKGPAVSSGAATEENPMVNYVTNKDGSVTVFFKDGTNSTTDPHPAFGFDPIANAHAQNPNLQDDINQLQARLDGTSRPPRVISPEEAAASASLIGGNMPGGLGFTPPPFADPSTMTGMWAGGTAGDVQVRPPDNFEAQFNAGLPFQVPNVSNNNINVAQNTGAQYPVDDYFSESFGEMMRPQPQPQPQAPITTSSPENYFSESITNAMPSQGFAPSTGSGSTPITSDQVDISESVGFQGPNTQNTEPQYNPFWTQTGPPKSLGFNINEKIMPPSPDMSWIYGMPSMPNIPMPSNPDFGMDPFQYPDDPPAPASSPDMSWMYGMPNIPSFNIPMPSNPDFGMDPFQYPDDPNPAPASTTPRAIYGMPNIPSMPSFKLPISDSITGGPSNTDRTRARRDAMQKAKAGQRGSLG
tara:strand:- start:5 stop:3076 length:3072 start_codon:yes stop_codon:yes gene_type:complete